jgi:hypothetical protein
LILSIRAEEVDLTTKVRQDVFPFGQTCVENEFYMLAVAGNPSPLASAYLIFDRLPILANFEFHLEKDI